MSSFGQKELRGGTQTYQIPEGFQTQMYLIKGALKMNGFGLVDNEHLVVFEKESGQLIVTFKEEGQFLLLCGKPIEEKIEQYGPYVMNSQTELLEAMRDYQMGKMGILIEEDL